MALARPPPSLAQPPFPHTWLPSPLETLPTQRLYRISPFQSWSPKREGVMECGDGNEEMHVAEPVLPPAQDFTKSPYFLVTQRPHLKSKQEKGDLAYSSREDAGTEEITGTKVTCFRDRLLAGLWRASAAELWAGLPTRQGSALYPARGEAGWGRPYQGLYQATGGRGEKDNGEKMLRQVPSSDILGTPWQLSAHELMHFKPRGSPRGSSLPEAPSRPTSNSKQQGRREH